jgi:hypothetical protein
MSQEDNIVKLCDVQGHAFALQSLDRYEPIANDDMASLVARFRRTFYQDMVIGGTEIVMKEPDTFTKYRCLLIRLDELIKG